MKAAKDWCRDAIRCGCDQSDCKPTINLYSDIQKDVIEACVKQMCPLCNIGEMPTKYINEDEGYTAWYHTVECSASNLHDMLVLLD